MTKLELHDLWNTVKVIRQTITATTHCPLLCGRLALAIPASLWMRVCCLVPTILLLFGNSADADDKLLIRAEVNGKPTSLYEKVVVTSGKASISKEPSGTGEPIEPFAIFFKLKTDTGQKEQNGYVRVGSSVGKPLGWIRKQDVTEWNTRFILEPTPPVPGKAFSVNLGGGNTAELKVVPSGKRRFALVTASTEAKEADDDPKFQVVVYAGGVQTAGTGGTLARERNEIRDLKLEIVFVLESSDFMLNTFDDVNVFDSVKRIITDALKEVRNDSSLRGAIRVGVVEYQDSTQKAKFASRVTIPLSDDVNAVESSLSKLTPTKIEGDWPDDVLAGLNTAVDQSGWAGNSVKHVILLGSSSCQLNGKGVGSNQVGGDWNSVVQEYNKRLNEDMGFNSSGLTIRQLLGRANPQAGSTEDKARGSKTFHTILVGREEEKLEPKLQDLVEKVVKSPDAVLEALLEKDTIDIKQIIQMVRSRLVKHQRALARDQYREISKNEGVEGLFIEAEPDAGSIRNAAQQLSKTLIDSFRVLSGVRAGEATTSTLERGPQNAISQTFYAIVGAAADKFKDLPTLAGSASTRDDRGREVALRKVLVAQHELQRLRSTLDAIHKKFQARVAKVDRQDVTQILDDLKQLAAQTTSGQRQFAAEVQLKDVITDLPLRTNALETTPRDLAVMPSDAFKQWLNKLEAAIFRADDLINGKADWLELSSLAENEKFTFLQVSELP